MDQSCPEPKTPPLSKTPPLLREASDSEIWGVFGVSANLTDFWRVLEPFPIENRDLGGPKCQNFSPAAGSSYLFYKGKWPAAGEKNWHLGVSKQGFTRGNWPAAGEIFWHLGPILRGKSGQNWQPRKPPNPGNPENPPLVNSQIEDKGGGVFGSRQD